MGGTTLHVCQKEFISGMAAGKIPLELSAVNSLSNHGGATTVGDLKAIYEAVNFAASTKDNGFVVVIPDVPVNKESIVITSSSPSATPLGQTPRTAAPSAGCLCYCVRSRLTPCFLTGAAADLKESAGPPWLQKLPQQTKAATGRLHQPLSQRRSSQEVVPGSAFHWIPTSLMWADGLTKHSKELQQSLHEWLQRPRVTLRQQTS